MFGRIKDTVNIINYCAFCLILIICTLASGAQKYTLLLLFFVFLTNYTVRAYLLSGEKPFFRMLSTFVDLVLVSLICLIDTSAAAMIIFIFLIDDIILNNSKKAGAALFIVDYACFCLSLFQFLKGRTDYFVIMLLISIPAFGLVAIVFLLINYQIEQNALLSDALIKLTVSKLESEALYKELKAAYEKAEDSAAQGERNRIAREIHDTVGHTLTTVLVELEAASMLIETDTARAGEKLALAQGQVRKGLNDIRRSVRMLEDRHEILDFFDSVDALLNDCRQNWGVAINSEIDRTISIPEEYAKVLYASLQEGLTNGKRHGKSTAFVIKLVMQGDRIVLSVEDNGKGISAVSPGFGLRAMRDRAQAVGGTMSFETEEGEGFSLYIMLPIHLGELPSALGL